MLTTLQTVTRFEELSRGRLLPVETDGMEPILRDGVFALLYRGETIIRRCQLLVDGTVRLMLDNPRYAAVRPDILPKAEVDEMVLGRVVGACNPI